MPNKLDIIISNKKEEVLALKERLKNQPEHPIVQILEGKIKRDSHKSFKKALRSDKLSVISEIKRRSPSKGALAQISDPVALAKKYIAGGAAALSVLTDTQFFGGSLEDLSLIAQMSESKFIPILRKDFLIDKIQIAEAILAGADAVLCMVSVLKEQTRNMIEHVHALNMEALVEIHDEKELEIALESGAKIIGVNNRDLTTFQIDTNRAFQLLEKIPKEIVRVAESGILDPKLAQEYYQAGFDAVLIGEALVTSKSPSEFIKACKIIKR